MIEEEPLDMIKGLWEEHNHASFPRGFGGRDVNGIDFALLDADIAGCVTSYLKNGTLDVWRTAILGLCYHKCEFVIPILNEQGVEYYWRLGRLAELILEEIVSKGEGK